MVNKSMKSTPGKGHVSTPDSRSAGCRTGSSFHSLLLYALAVSGLACLGLSSCDTEGKHSAWYLPWAVSTLQFSDGLTEGANAVAWGGFRSLRFPDGTVRHLVLRNPGSGQALNLTVLDSGYQPVFSFSSRRLDSLSLEHAWTDEYSKIHLPSGQGTGDLLAPPSGASDWALAPSGDPAWYFAGSNYHRLGLGSPGTLDIALNLDSWPEVRLTWAQSTHNPDGSLVETPASTTWQSLLLFSDGLDSLLTQAWPDQGASHSAAEFQTALADLASQGPGSIPVQTLAVRLVPHPTLGWNRPVIHLFFHVLAAADPLLAHPSELIELAFPAFFPGEDPVSVLSGPGAGILTARVRSQAGVFADPAQSPLLAADIYASAIQASSDGLVLARTARIQDTNAAWLMHWNNSGSPDPDHLLVLPDAASSASWSDLPLLPDWTTDWLVWEQASSNLWVNKAWWENLP